MCEGYKSEYSNVVLVDMIKRSLRLRARGKLERTETVCRYDDRNSKPSFSLPSLSLFFPFESSSMFVDKGEIADKLRFRDDLLERRPRGIPD